MMTTRRSISLRRILQFSLRGLLMLVAVCSVWLGIAFHRAREQARAVAVIKASGGYVFYDYHGVEAHASIRSLHSKVPAWLLENLGVDFFHDATLVVFDVIPIEDDVLETVSTLPEVRYLFFLCSHVTDNGLAQLNRLAKLEVLGMSASENDAGEFDPPSFTDEGLAVLSSLHELHELQIDHATVSDRGLEHLKGLSKLERVVLLDTEVTRGGAEELHKALPKCNIFVARGDFDEVFSGGPDVPFKESFP